MTLNCLPVAHGCRLLDLEELYMLYRLLFLFMNLLVMAVLIRDFNDPDNRGN